MYSFAWPGAIAIEACGVDDKQVGALVWDRMRKNDLPKYRDSIPGTLLAAREAVMNPIRPYLREIGLTEQQWRVLRALLDEGELDLNGLSKAAMLHPPTVTRIVRELTSRGLIERRADQRDGRRSFVTLKQEGRMAVNLIVLHTIALSKLLEERFGADRLKHLREELADLTRVMNV